MNQENQIIKQLSIFNKELQLLTIKLVPLLTYKEITTILIILNKRRGLLVLLAAVGDCLDFLALLA